MVLMLSAVLIVTTDNTVALRESIANALKSITLIFALLVALSIAFFNNNINGLHKLYSEKVMSIRDKLESFHDLFHKSEDELIKQLYGSLINPLLCLSYEEWMTFDKANSIRTNNDELLEKIQDANQEILPRYLLRIEDEINLLGLLFIRRILVSSNMKIMEGGIILVITGMVSIALSYVLPSMDLFNYLAILFGAAVISLALIEVVFILSYYRQVSRDEEGILLEDEET
ncbi:MAG: hypothetical protein JAZ19_12095 [Candidatus Thiodiazotropha taylori]|nr:hypothetical protein [Candidatus Thiodiazotropha taylori]